MTSGENPLNLIPMDLEFPTIPILVIFLIYLYLESFFCCAYFLSLVLLIEVGGYCILLIIYSHPITVNNNCIYLCNQQVVEESRGFS